MACAYELPLSVVIESRGETYRYESCMVETSGTSAAKNLIIDYPVTDGPAVAIKPEMEMTLSFTIDEGQLVFNSTVMRKTTRMRRERGETVVLEIEYPNILKHSQRRDHFRVPIPLRKQIHAECILVGDDTTQTSKGKRKKGSEKGVHFEGTIINISVGGVLMAVEDVTDIPMKTGASLVLSFSLAKNETPLELRGVVRRLEKGESDTSRKLAVEFIETEETFEHRLAVNRLYRYVTERQREMANHEEQ
jgi:c-di-GMP-binding flagellar brake protein YcgR